MDNIISTDLREKYYRRNYITMLFEGFFFSFAISIFSYTTVLPVYVSNLSNNKFWISLLIVSFFGLSNASSIFSSVIGVNARSAKWASVIICSFQRLGQFLIYISTFAVTKNSNIALLLFFSSYSLYAVTAGMSSPVFSNMISNIIYRNVSSFYGSYSLVGALSGVLGSQLVRVLIAKYNFPVNYQYLFLSGLVMAIIATFVVIFGVKEIESDNKSKLKFSDLPKIVSGIFKNNHKFRNIIIVRGFIAVAEMTVPFYIIKVSGIEGVSISFVGIMSTVLLLSNLFWSKTLGHIGDKKGPFFLMEISCVAGVLASLLAIFINSSIIAYPLFILVSLTTLSAQLSNSVSVIVYSTKGLVPVFAAMSGLIIAPFYAFSSFGGGLLAEKSDYNILFILSGIIYLLGFIFLRNYHKGNF